MPQATEKLKHRLTAQDASFIYGESNNGPLHIGSMAFFEDEISFEELARHMESKMPLLPRYRQRLMPVPFNLNHATFEDDPDFRVENQLTLHCLPPGAGEKELIAAAMAVFSKPLDRRRPLWELHLFNGFEGKRSVILWSVHHCMVDGVSGMELLTVVMDFRPDPPPTEAPAQRWTPRPLPGRVLQVVDGAIDLAEIRLEFIRQASQALSSGSITDRARATVVAASRLAQKLLRPLADAPWNARLVSQARTFAWLRTSFADVRAIRSAFGGTINDVVLTMLAEGAARYLRHHGVRPGAPFRLGCPVNVRRESESGSLGNRVSMMFPELPAEPMNPVGRLNLVMAETQRIKEMAEADEMDRLVSTGDIVPPVLMAPLGRALTGALDLAVSLGKAIPPLARLLAPGPVGISFVATNVPGAQVPLYLAGHRMVDYIGLLPLGVSLGFGVPILSYNQNLYFTIMAEPNLMPDPDLMKSFVEQVFEELKAAAEITSSVLVAIRTAPKLKAAAKPAPASAPASLQDAGSKEVVRSD